MESMLCVFSFPLAAFSHQPSADVYSSSPLSHISHRQMSIPPRHLWRGGGRQAGGEVWGTGLDDKRRQMRIHFLYRIKNNISTKHPTLSS